MSGMVLYTTLDELKKHSPCTNGYRKLLTHIGLDYPADKPIDLLTILEANDLDDTSWALRAALPEADRDRIAKLFACDCAASVLHFFEDEYPDDRRPRNAIETARRYALGQATKDELEQAMDASWEASWDASAAAAPAARSASASASASASTAARSASAASAASAVAARSAAADAYVDAAWSVEAAAAAEDERLKQSEILKSYLRN